MKTFPVLAAGLLILAVYLLGAAAQPSPVLLPQRYILHSHGDTLFRIDTATGRTWVREIMSVTNATIAQHQTIDGWGGLLVEHTALHALRFLQLTNATQMVKYFDAAAYQPP